jgi:soluble lytic murein transglycosylase
MRQESAFNPLARSSADAFGLMQLLPRVAKSSALKNNIPLNQDADLFKPHVNIPLGSAHLSDLWEKYNGQFILAVASYNASEKAIQNWLSTRYRGDSLEFIEDIPYEETRSYVKLVMRNLVFYQRIYATEPIPFPEWCLEIIQDQQT